jgi:hypothetical protein
VNFQVTGLKILVSYPDGFADVGSQARHGYPRHQGTRLGHGPSRSTRERARAKAPDAFRLGSGKAIPAKGHDCVVFVNHRRKDPKEKKARPGSPGGPFVQLIAQCM